MPKFFYTWHVLCFLFKSRTICQQMNKFLKWILAQGIIITKLLSRTVTDNDSTNERFDLERRVINCQGRNRKELRRLMGKEFTRNTWADTGKRSDSSCLLMPLEAQRCSLDQIDEAQRILCPHIVLIVPHTDIDAFWSNSSLLWKSN